MIELRVATPKKLPDKFKNLGYKVRPLIIDYYTANLNPYIRQTMRTLASNYIYKKLTKETGKIAKSMTLSDTRRVNQYAMDVGFYFDPKIAPHASTQIPDGDPGMVRISGKGKQLSIPLTGGPADKKGKRVSPKSLGGNWYVFRGTKILCQEGSTTGYFVLKPSVMIPQRVYGEQLAIELNRGLTPILNRLAAQALKGL